jgi:hypothetical protein
VPETNGQAEGSAVIDPSENLTGWLEARKARDAGAEEQTGQSEQPATPAEPTVAVPDLQNQPAAVDWREFVLPEDVPHGFFKGKKLPEVFESISHAERAKQAAERERNEYRRELEALKAERAAPPKPSQPDPRTIIAESFYEDPGAVANQIAELARQEARQIFTEEQTRLNEQTAVRQTFDAGKAAMESVAAKTASEYGWNPQAAEMNVVATFPFLRNLLEQGYTDAFTNPEHAERIIRQMHGDPRPAAPTIQAPPVPQLPDPPGSGRNAARQPNVKESALRDEDAKTYEAVAKLVGLDSDRFKKRGAASRR